MQAAFGDGTYRLGGEHAAQRQHKPGCEQRMEDRAFRRHSAVGDHETTHPSVSSPKGPNWRAVPWGSDSARFPPKLWRVGAPLRHGRASGERSEKGRRRKVVGAKRLGRTYRRLVSRTASLSGSAADCQGNHPTHPVDVNRDRVGQINEGDHSIARQSRLIVWLYVIALTDPAR